MVAIAAPGPLAASRPSSAGRVLRCVGLVSLAVLLIWVRPAASQVVATPTASVIGGLLAALVTPRPATAAWVALEPEARDGYRRGRRRTIQVVRLGEHEVEVSTARAFLAMREAAARDGVDLEISSGFRSRAEQAELYRAWRQRRGNKAARPGRSNHQSGRAIDLYVSVPGARAWLDGNAARFGFARTVKGEPWHWEHVHAPRAVAKRSKWSAAKAKAKRRAAAKAGKARGGRSRTARR